MVTRGLIYTSSYIKGFPSAEKTEKRKEKKSIMNRFKELKFNKSLPSSLPYNFHKLLIISRKNIYSNCLKLKTREIRNKRLHDMQMDILLEEFLNKGVIEEAPKLLRRTRKQMKIRVVLNADNTTRLIGHNSFINKMVKPFTVIKVPDPKKRLHGLLINDDFKYIFKIDLKNGYFNAKVNKKSRQWFTFTWKNKFYWFRCMPIGQGDSPVRFQNLVYNLIITPTLTKLKHIIRGLENISYSNYLDDLIGACSSNIQHFEALQYVYEETFNIAKASMTNLNEKKSFPPRTFGNILGFLIDTETKLITMSQNTKDKMLRYLQMFPTPFLNLFGLMEYYKEYMNVKDLVTFTVMNKFKRFFSPAYVLRNLTNIYLNLYDQNFTCTFEQWKLNFTHSKIMSKMLDKYAVCKEEDPESYVWQSGTYVLYMNVLHCATLAAAPAFQDFDTSIQSAYIRERLNQIYAISLGQPLSVIENTTAGFFRSYCYKKDNGWFNRVDVPFKYTPFL